MLHHFSLSLYYWFTALNQILKVGYSHANSHIFSQQRYVQLEFR